VQLAVAVPRDSVSPQHKNKRKESDIRLLFLVVS